MRVVSGKYKNRILKSFPGQLVRPTSGIVRKSIFEILQPLTNKTILDLFSGIGGVGIEALSRGAYQVTFVEKNKKVSKILSDNLNAVCADDNYNIIIKDAYIFLESHTKKYDIIFADPPYGLIGFNDLKFMVSDLLNYGGIFCMETRGRDNKDKYKDVKIKNYGKTQIIIWEKKEK